MVLIDGHEPCCHVLRHGPPWQHLCTPCVAALHIRGVLNATDAARARARNHDGRQDLYQPSAIYETACTECGRRGLWPDDVVDGRCMWCLVPEAAVAGYKPPPAPRRRRAGDAGLGVGLER